jgi:hypothetical protein
MHSHHHLSMSLAIALCPACAVEGDATEFREIEESGGGIVFNTNHIDDARFSELAQPLGQVHMGLSLESVELKDGTAIEHFLTENGQLVAYDALGSKYTGAALLGSAWLVGVGGTMPTTKPERPMYLAQAVLNDEGERRYGFVHEAEADGGELLLRNCPDGPDGPAYAQVLVGFSLDEATGDVVAAPDVTYLACDTGAVGKAAALGYYEPARTDGTWGDFETAVRAVRADYCYDGESHTEPGVGVIFEDRWGIRFTEVEYRDNPIEAVWGADGLICAGEGRSGDGVECGDEVPVCLKGATLMDYPDGYFLTRLAGLEMIAIELE